MFEFVLGSFQKQCCRSLSSSDSAGILLNGLFKKSSGEECVNACYFQTYVVLSS